MSGLGRLWRGEIALASVFWNWAVFGGLAINLASSGLFLFLIMSDRPLAAIFFGYALSVPYNIVVAVAVCRSAERYPGERRWADLARIVTVAGMVVLSLT